jgi:methionyl aminopeptidase
MEREILEKYRKAGSICSGARKLVEKDLKPGVRLLDIAERIEAFIREQGGRPAFPVNISINETAAHYTPCFGDTKEIGEGDLVKIDIGAHVDGYIGDMAFTYCPEGNELVKAAEKVLEKAIGIIRPGVTVGEIGSKIEETAHSLGKGVIVNLTGHSLDRYVFHGPPSILNVRNDSKYSFREGDVIALEPFIADSNGQIRDSSPTEIYRYLMDRPVRLPEARRILSIARDEFRQLPFAKRWLYREFSPVKISMGLRQLESAGAIEGYPVLKEASGRPIAQAEHTMIVMDKPLVTTR